MSGCPACAECGRLSFALTVEGWCARCEMLVSAQARIGLEALDAYLGKVAAFQVWDANYRRMSA